MVSWFRNKVILTFLYNVLFAPVTVLFIIGGNNSYFAFKIILGFKCIKMFDQKSQKEMLEIVALVDHKVKVMYAMQYSPKISA